MGTFQDVPPVALRAFALARYLEYKYSKGGFLRCRVYLNAIVTFSFPVVWGSDTMLLADRRYRANKQKKKRISKTVREILASYCNCYFLTLTLNDITLAFPQAKRRKIVKSFIESVSGAYVYNVDYGSKNGREHYHAVIGTHEICFDGWNPYGTYDIEKINNQSTSAVVASYIAKLVNHAAKDTTGRAYRSKWFIDPDIFC